MNRPIASLPIAPGLRAKLTHAGFRIWRDISSMSAAELAKEIGVPPEEAVSIIRSGKDADSTPKNITAGKSALELLKKERAMVPITTSSDLLDMILGGGVAMNKITEFCGVPGIGKTQLGIQLALNVQIPNELGGAQGECIYIDTEGSFIPDRVYEMASHYILCMKKRRDLHRKSPQSDASEHYCQISNEEGSKPEQILSKIHYYRVKNMAEQTSLNWVLPQFLSQHPQVRLIILDSITFHFRHDFEDMGQRSRLLQTTAQSYLSMAEKFNLAVVMMNQATTKIDSDEDAHLTPALGESWGHTCTHRVILYWGKGQRQAYLSKSPSLPPQSVSYQISEKGICDVSAPDSQEAHAKKLRP